MKKLKILLAVLFALLFPCIMAVYGNNNSDNETSSLTKNETVTLPQLKTDKTHFKLSTSSASLSIVIKEGMPHIASMKTKNGTEAIKGEQVIKLPDSCETNGKASKFNWIYLGYTEYRNSRTTVGYIFYYKDKKMDMFFEEYVVCSPKYSGPFEFYGYFRNNENNSVEIFPGEQMDLDVTGVRSPVAWTFNKEGGMAQGWKIFSGQYFEGTGIYKTVLDGKNQVSTYTSTYQDWNASGDIPMIYLDYGTCGIYIAEEWSNCRIEAKSIGANDVTLTAHLAKEGFHTTIQKGGLMLIPGVYIGVYTGDIDDGSNGFKRWFLHCKAPECMVKNPNEPLTQQDMQIGYNVSQYGIQSIKWDYGWWSDTPEAGWKSNEGLLEVHNSSYLGVLKSCGCKTLAEFVKKANEADVKLALYILLKDTKLEREGVPTSVGPDGHPDWFSNVCITGVGNSADLGNVECVSFFKDYMLKFFRETGVTTWRSDFEPICRASDKPNRHDANGVDTQYWCTIGFAELVDYLYENLKDFRYESCSSGGSMKDFFTMTKAAVINCDDSADYMSLHMSFYDSSYCIHPAQLQLPCNARTYTRSSVNYTGTADYVYGLRCVLTGGVMLSNWGGTTDEDKSYWPHYIADLYNTKIKPLIREGDLYHILDRPDGVHWDGIMYADADSPNETKGLIMLWKPTKSAGESKTINLRGLNKNTLYKLTFEDRPNQNLTATGLELMEKGLTVTIPEETGSEMIWINEA